MMVLLTFSAKDLESTISKMEKAKATGDYQLHETRRPMSYGSASGNGPETLLLKTVIRQYETKFKNQESELEKLKKSSRFTRIAELETEIRVYYQEVQLTSVFKEMKKSNANKKMVKLKTVAEEYGDIKTAFDRLQDYKQTVAMLVKKVQKLAEREAKWKVFYGTTTTQREAFKASIADLRRQNQGLSDKHQESLKQVKDLQQRMKNVQLHKAIQAKEIHKRREVRLIRTNRAETLAHPNQTIKLQDQQLKEMFAGFKVAQDSGKMTSGFVSLSFKNNVV